MIIGDWGLGIGSEDAAASDGCQIGDFRCLRLSWRQAGSED